MTKQHVIVENVKKVNYMTIGNNCLGLEHVGIKN